MNSQNKKDQIKQLWLLLNSLINEEDDEIENLKKKLKKMKLVRF